MAMVSLPPVDMTMVWQLGVQLWLMRDAKEDCMGRQQAAHAVTPECGHLAMQWSHVGPSAQHHHQQAPCAHSLPPQYPIALAHSHLLSLITALP
jgi:hypothetical protein